MHEPLPLRTATAADIPRLQHVLHRDYETRSRVVLKVVGAHRYAADPSTEVLCCAYAVDNNPVQLWRPSDPVPIEFRSAGLPGLLLLRGCGDVAHIGDHVGAVP